MSKYVVSMAVVLTLGLGGRAAEGLGIGDPAPKLEVKEFVKGDPVKELARGKIHVVEFWATWCGPCIATIPHLTELQKKHKDVIFIGVSVFETNPAEVPEFVKKMGEKMDYRVALDAVADGAKGQDGKMATNWMKAAKQRGIPTAFIVNGEGKIAWIGHPAGMDKPLEEIVAGKWDIAKAADDFKKAQAAQAKMEALFEKLRTAQESNDPKALLGVIDEAIKDEPALEQQLASMKVGALLKTGETDKLIDYSNRLVDGVYKDSAQGLNNIAWALVEKPGDKPNQKLMQVALRAAKRADELAKGQDGAIADTLAKAYFETGDVTKALENQERAVKLAVGTPLESDQEMKARLEQYRKAAKK
jgi:thiol-disulfide isomerase/thioredoxin